MLLNPTQRLPACPYEPFTMVWNDGSGLRGMDADDLPWMNLVC
jgi:hypothetical protein